MSMAEWMIGTERLSKAPADEGTALKSGARERIWLGRLSLIMACALLLVALAYTGSRMEAAWAQPLFWFSYLLLLAPVCLRLALPEVNRKERIGLVVVTGISFYLLKMFYSPLLFTMGDELQHWRTTYDIVQTEQLFQPNAILPVSPFFPGLENVTMALISVSGLSIFAAGALVIGIARVLFALGLFLFYEKVGGSARIAGLSALIYMANPHFIFFDAQYGYESLALPLTLFTLYVVIWRENTQGKEQTLLTLAALLGLGAVIITHHITSFMLMGLLLTWAGLAYYQRSTATYVNPNGIALLSVVVNASWIAFVAYNVIGYLSPWFSGMVRELVALLLLESGPRPFFQSSAGQTASWGLQVTTITSVLLILAALPFGMRVVWRRYGFHPIALTLVLISCCYPVLQVVRLTPVGLAIATRITAMVFVGVAFVLAVAVVHFLEKRQFSWSALLRVQGWLLLIFVGSMASILSAWQLPGPQIAGSYTRSLDNERVAAAEWSRATLGPGQRFAAPMEHPSIFVVGSYGEQRVVTHVADRIWLQSLYTEPQVDEGKKNLLRRGQVDYLWEDTQATALRLGQPAQSTSAPQAAQATKFDALPKVDRLFDSGAIIIYDVEIYQTGGNAQ